MNQFTIDALDTQNRPYRLQNDNSWRIVVERDILSRCILSQDHIVRDFKDTIKYSTGQGVITLLNQTLYVNPTEPTKYKGMIFTRVHRSEKPRKFKLPELMRLLWEGNDMQRNDLVLTVNGEFNLFNGVGIDWRTYPIAVRMYEFPSNEDFVGPRSDNEDYVRGVYSQMLLGWLEHLRSGKFDVLIRSQEISEVSELWEEVDKLFP